MHTMQSNPSTQRRTTGAAEEHKAAPPAQGGASEEVCLPHFRVEQLVRVELVGAEKV